MKKLIFFLGALCLIVLQSCDELKPNIISNRATGNSGDLTIAISDDLWKAKTGKEMRKKFDAWEPGLGAFMAEKKFNINRVNLDDLKIMFKSHRNVLIVKIDSELPSDSVAVEIRRDVWANQQLHVMIRANSEKQLVSYFKKKGRKLVDRFEDSERKRLVETYKTHPSVPTQNKIKEAFSINMTIDKGFKVVSDSYGFMMVERSDRFKRMEFDSGGDEKLNILEGFMIWEKPYADQIQFDKRYINMDRDTTLKYHVKYPGYENSYMGTEYDTLVYPVQSVFKLDGNYAVETKGHVKSFGHVLGGPFVQVSFLHPKTKKVISIMGWVHAPNVDKIELMRHLEAMIYDITCVAPKVKTEK
jgi:hypothetical protein